MNETERFIQIYLGLYLLQCQNYSIQETQDVTPVPPTYEELLMLLAYLQANQVDFTIVGSFAIVRYLELTKEDFHNRIFRPTNFLEILISSPLPPPPEGWNLNDEKDMWFSSQNHSVKFLEASQIFSTKEINVGKDSESVVAKCPIADVLTLSVINLNLGRTKDLMETVTLWRKVGIPENLEEHLWNDKQLKLLELIKLGPWWKKEPL